MEFLFILERIIFLILKNACLIFGNRVTTLVISNAKKLLKNYIISIILKPRPKLDLS